MSDADVPSCRLLDDRARHPGHISDAFSSPAEDPFSRRIALLLEVEDGSSEQLRKAASAAIVIADLKMIT